jgi:hypothetical protein
MFVRIQFLQSQSYALGHAQFMQNVQPVQDEHFRHQFRNPCLHHSLTLMFRLVDCFLEEGHHAFKNASPAALSQLIATHERPANIAYPFRFVADDRGAYRTTAARCMAYSKSVLGLTGSASQVFRTLLTKDYKKLEAVVVFLVQRCKSLDDLQHELMHLQFFFRLSTLVVVPPAKLREDLKKHLDELEPTAQSWSTLVFIRKKAMNCIPDTKETRIKWLSAERLEYMDPKSGKKTVVSRQNMVDLNNHFATLAEGILDSFGVPCLTDEQLASIQDPLSTSGDADRVSLLHYNDALATELSASASIVVKDLDSLCILHTCVSVRCFIPGNFVYTTDHCFT